MLPVSEEVEGNLGDREKEPNSRLNSLSRKVKKCDICSTIDGENLCNIEMCDQTLEAFDFVGESGCSC